jgi:hypothetical protein
MSLLQDPEVTNFSQSSVQLRCHPEFTSPFEDRLPFSFLLSDAAVNKGKRGRTTQPKAALLKKRMP